MLATGSKSLRIIQLGISEQDRAGLALVLDQHRSSNCIVVSEGQQSACILDLDSIHGQRSLQHQLEYHSHPPLILFSIRGQWIMQLVEPPLSHLVSFEKARKILENRAFSLDVHPPGAYEASHLPGANNLPIVSLRFPAYSRLTTNRPCITWGAEVSPPAANLLTEHNAKIFLLDTDWAALSPRSELERVKAELIEMQESSNAFRKQSAEDIARLSAERFDLECKLKQQQERLSVDKAIEQQQITALQQSLTEAREAHLERERELQSALDETYSNAERTTEALNSEIGKLQLNQASLEQVLEETRVQLAQAHAEHQQLMQEKSRLAECLQTETTRALESMLHSQSLEEHRQRLEKELEALQQDYKDSEVQSQSAIASLREELEQAQYTIHELGQSNQQQNETLQQLRVESQAQVEQLKQALETKIKHASEEQSRMAATIEGLNTELNTTRIEALSQRRKRAKLKLLLKRESRTAEYLKRLLKTTKDELEISKKALTEAARTQQEQLTELQQKMEQACIEKNQLFEQLQQELKVSQEAWEQASESDLAVQVTRQELVALKVDLEQEITNLRAQLEHQQESSIENLNQHIEEKEILQQSIEASQTALQRAHATITSLKRDRQLLREAEARFEGQFAQLEEKARARQAKLTTAVDSGRQEIESLRQMLQQAEDEKASLRREIDGLREVQLEMASPLNEETEKEIRALRSALEMAKSKLNKTERQAQQADALQRECQLQDSAIALLGEDLGALTKEKESLRKENDRLNSQLNDIRERHTEPNHANGQFHSDMSADREQATDSSLANDPLIQTDEQRIKKENCKPDRNETKTEFKRMRRGRVVSRRHQYRKNKL